VTDGTRPDEAVPAGLREAGERCDVIVVGARCAGSSLAALLARAGLKVVVLEQASFPRPTLSSHLFEADALSFLNRLGVLGAVQKTGARFMRQADIRLNDLRFVTEFPLRFDDAGGAAFVRRHLLDSILADAAAEAGADVRMSTRVIELLWDRGRVCGVRAAPRGRPPVRLYAPLVVGADGRDSTVAAQCSARKYNVIPNGRSYYFTFFEGADPAYSDLFVFHRWGDRMVWGGPADSGLYLVGISPETHERESFTTEAERGLLAHVRACAPAAQALAGARVTGRAFGIKRFHGYFRECTGPGWVLAGDAGHFKDPALGRGIGDAFLQSEALAPAILSGLGESGVGLDRALGRWAQWRDRKFEGHYWLASTLGQVGAVPSLLPEVVERLRERGELDKFFDLFSHRARLYDVMTAREVGTATGRMLLAGRSSFAQVARETTAVAASVSRHRWISRYPRMAPQRLTAAALLPPRRPLDDAGADSARDLIAEGSG
jgi:flavin-dependent dehydrogenase